MVSFEPEQRIRFPTLKAQWWKQTFVHWPYEPDEVQTLLPDGLEADQYDGAAWVSLTPFTMADVRPLGLPVPRPSLFAFPETNLRTYVRLPDGRDGLWFLTNEVGSAAMLAACAIGAPYHLGDLSVYPHDGVVTYAGSRRGGEPSYHLVVHPGGPIELSERDIWLTGRWHAYTQRLGVLWEIPVSHEPWRLVEATVGELHETLTRAAGLPAPTTVPVVHFSECVRHVRLGTSRPVRLTRG